MDRGAVRPWEILTVRQVVVVLQREGDRHVLHPGADLVGLMAGGDIRAKVPGGAAVWCLALPTRPPP